MKFLKDIIQVSSCLSQNLVDPCDAQDIPEPSHQLFCQCSTHHNRLPINDDPNNAYPKQEIPVEEDEMNDLSASLQERLYLMKEGTQHAYEYGPYSQLLSEYERSLNHISELIGHDNDVEGHLLEHHNDTWLPILYGNSDYLLNGNSYGNSTSSKTKTFIETKVAAMKLQGFNH